MVARERLAAEPFTELGKPDAPRGRPHGQQAERGHSGNTVGLQQERPIFQIQSEVDPTKLQQSDRARQLNREKEGMSCAWNYLLIGKSEASLSE